jgi:putative transposase
VLFIEKKMKLEDPHYRRNLPHFLPDDAPYFVTFRLADSVPESQMKQLHFDRERELKLFENLGNLSVEERRNIQKRYFAKYDKLLDYPKKGPYWLQDEAIAKIVQHHIHRLEETDYTLWAYTIMSNHVHILFTSDNSTKKLYEVMQLLNGRSSIECNRILNRKGSFWQGESYDHVVRENEFGRIVQYILLNPVKAGLVARWQDWPWTYLHASIFGF